ncbi:hypothetical protein SERLA73DRAFT_149200 [Serpula lacrymans var. lacrymans S7.3]|uniref:Uncharacterized protein n=1 Tax=Serpula lacrymans var. lacrymans (strain S7.3) TaxID=936435 RepID=F8PGE1_SERL3|nr:hypothetical protein SERLA73DRAFT_149200 [Serpula lacrymans var. lacrymans S7.3]
MEMLDSADFRKLLNDRLRACLFSPNLTAYVTDLGDHIFEFLEKNPNVFKFKQEFLHDPKIGNIKPKLRTSIQKKQEIATLTKALILPGMMEITMAHRVRIAFLCTSLVEFHRIIASQGSNQDTPHDHEEASSDNGDGNQFEGRATTPMSKRDIEETDSKTSDFTLVTTSSLKLSKSTWQPMLSQGDWSLRLTQ